MTVALTCAAASLADAQLKPHPQSIEASRRKETEVLEDIMRSGSAARGCARLLLLGAQC